MSQIFGYIDDIIRDSINSLIFRFIMLINCRGCVAFKYNINTMKNITGILVQSIKTLT